MRHFRFACLERPGGALEIIPDRLPEIDVVAEHQRTRVAIDEALAGHCTRIDVRIDPEQIADSSRRLFEGELLDLALGDLADTFDLRLDGPQRSERLPDRLAGDVPTESLPSRDQPVVADEFERSHHAAAGNILASLDNFLAETVEGNREPFNPHSPTPGMAIDQVNGMASVDSGCRQCHGSKVALEGTDGSLITVDELAPDENGKPTNRQAVAGQKSVELWTLESDSDSRSP